MSATILVVEDDANLRLALQDNLEDAGHTVRVAATVAAARLALADGAPDLIVLDVMLPDGDGYSLCRALRAEGRATPVLMLTARSLEDDLVRGFDVGADDYVTKPYRLRELLARVQALLRRGGARPTAARRLGPFTVDPVARLVTGPAGPVDLTATEFELLTFFLDRVGEALTRDAILDAVWGADVVVDPRTVDNFVSSLKKKLAWNQSASWRILSVRGVGYRLEAA
ncbi:MAG: response regulator transcription factor [Myxococcales bacterium]|nr:response regulator transcription factor [Myxococcales bacterium]